MTLAEAIEKLPKTDLHCHLDGAIRPETILDIAKKHRLDFGSLSLNELKKRLVLGERVSSLENFLKAFDITCAVMQWGDAIERIAFELAEDSAKENVRYLEVRMAPGYRNSGNLSDADVMRSIRRGLARAEKKYPIRTNMIVCAIRIFEPSESIEMAKLAVSLKNEGVVGFDLAHAERNNPAGNHREAFEIVKKGGVHRTVHAGEDDGPQSIRQALDLCFAERLGHGLTLYQDPELEARVAREGITVECCPSSNVQISLIPSWKDHPLPRYLKNGVKATLNTDNRLLTGIRVTDEYLRAAKTFDLTWNQIKTIALNGFRGAFLPEDEKASFLKKTAIEIDQIGKKIS